eukprot:g15744.t1
MDRQSPVVSEDDYGTGVSTQKMILSLHDKRPVIVKLNATQSGTVPAHVVRTMVSPFAWNDVASNGAADSEEALLLAFRSSDDATGMLTENYSNLWFLWCVIEIPSSIPKKHGNINARALQYDQLMVKWRSEFGTRTWPLAQEVEKRTTQYFSFAPAVEGFQVHFFVHDGKNAGLYDDLAWSLWTPSQLASVAQRSLL